MSSISNIHSDISSIISKIQQHNSIKEIKQLDQYKNHSHVDQSFSSSALTQRTMTNLESSARLSPCIEVLGDLEEANDEEFEQE